MLSDLRQAFRQLAKSPGFTVIALLTLALGLGANTAIFSIVRSVLLRPLPYPAPDQLLQLWEYSPTNGSSVFVSGATFKHWRQEQTKLQGLAIVHPSALTLTGTHTPERLTGLFVSASYLGVLGIRPVLGDDFAADADQPGAQNHVIILSDTLWRNRYGADPGVIGRTVILDQVAYKIIGVLPPDAVPRSDAAFLLPVVIEANPWQTNPATNWATVTARLKPGVTIAEADAELDAIRQAHESEYPPERHGWSAQATPLREQLAGGSRPALMMLLGAGALVLLIACANVANLLLARATGRQREMAIRSALGASPARIARQVLLENTLLALLGGGVAVFVAVAMVDVLGRVTEAVEPARAGLQRAIQFRVTGGTLPQMLKPDVDWVVLLFTVVMAIVTGVAAGIVPALRASHADANRDLKDGTLSSSGRARTRSQSLLVASEEALTVLLLIGAGLFLRSFANTVATDPGFEAHRAAYFELSRPAAKYPTPRDVTRFAEQLTDHLAELPGVESVGVATTMPFSRDAWGGGVRLADRPGGRRDFVMGGRDYVAGNYFEAMGIPLRAGRYLTRADNQPDAPRTAVVNEALARTLFPSGGKAVGEQLVIDGHTYEIVGVVGSVRIHHLDGEARPCVYAPYQFNPGGLSIVIRSQLPVRDLHALVAPVIHALDPDQPVTLHAFSHQIDRSLAGQRTMLGLIAGFAMLAVTLACLGIYGVMAYTVGQRRRELGIRLALGALPQGLVTLVLRDGMRLAVIGLAIGLAAAFAGSRLIASMLYGVSASDPGVFLAVALLLALVAAVACWLPARRATLVDPISALRAE